MPSSITSASVQERVLSHQQTREQRFISDISQVLSNWNGNDSQVNDIKHSNREDNLSKGYKLFKKSKKQRMPTLVEYLTFLKQVTQFSEDVIMMAVELIRRFFSKNEGHELCLLRLAATALFIAQKLIFDTGYFGLTDFSHITGISTKYLQLYELEFCRVIDYSLHVSLLEVEMTKILISR